MAISLKAIGWIRFFTEARKPNMFLSRHFTVKPGGIYNGDKVAIDIERMDEEVAIVISKCTGPNLNDVDIFTTKEFEPPTYGEAIPLNVCDLINRQLGENPFDAANTGYMSKLIAMMVRGFAGIDNKINRAIELQASQILQTGMLSLTDGNGAVRYDLDFTPKTSHFPTVGTSWSAVGAVPLQDLDSLAQQIRADSGINPDKLIFGAIALRNFLANQEVKDQLDNRRMEVAEVAPRFADSGATFYGHVWVGTTRMEMWAYPETFKSPQTGLPVKYVADDKVIMMSTKTRFDKASARVPTPIPDPRVSFLSPGRLSSMGEGFDVTPNVYVSANGKQVSGELESRTLLIPVQIDGYGCIDTEI